MCARDGGGYATVVIKKPDGRTCAVFFSMGKPIGADASEADGYHEFRATKENDLHLIPIGNERYEIPGAVVLGGCHMLPIKIDGTLLITVRQLYTEDVEMRKDYFGKW